MKHLAHCCANHGCAYDLDDDCPIVALEHRQQTPCGGAEPCSRENASRAPRLPPRPLNFRVPPPSEDQRVRHLTGGAVKGK